VSAGNSFCHLDADADHTQTLHELKLELIEQGQKYVVEALSYRDKIAQLAMGFIKDDSVVSDLEVVKDRRLTTHTCL
jgi:hypothetical protein